MPAHYSTLKDQLKADILAAVGNTTSVIFGRPKREERAVPSAVIITRIVRENVVRQCFEDYEFTIDVRVPLPDPYPEDGGEVYAMEAAEYLVDRLAPHDTSSVPASPTPYASVGMMPQVTEVESVIGEDHEKWLGFRLVFSCKCVVYQ